MLIHKCKKGFVMLVQDTKFAGEIHDDQRYAQDSGAYTNGDLTSSGLSYFIQFITRSVILYAKTDVSLK